MATNFLQAVGTNGFIATPVDLLTTELNALADGNSALSSVAHSSTGKFTQTDYASAILAEVYLTLGGSFTPAAGSPDLLGWFIRSPDGGSTFEAVVSNTDLARPPDFVIPLMGSHAYSTGELVYASGDVKVPAGTHKVFVVNHGGATLPSTGNKITAAPKAIQY